MAHIVSPLCILSDSVSCCDHSLLRLLTSGPSLSSFASAAGHNNTQTQEKQIQCQMSEIDNPLLHFILSLPLSDFKELNICLALALYLMSEGIFTIMRKTK